MALNAAELQIVITADASQAQGELNSVEGMISGVLVGHRIKEFGEDALGFVGDFISVGATFEEQMTLIDRIIGGSISHMDELKQKAIDADVRTMFDALQVTQGMEMLARAGFDAMQIIGQPGQNNGLIDAVLNFAGATNESTEVAGRSFAAVARIFQNSGVSMIDIADLMTAAVLRSGKSASEFMTAFQYVGSISQQFGTAPEDIVTVIALMEQLGVRSMSVGTSLRSFYSGIASNRGDIEALGISLFTVNDAGQEVLRTLPDIIQQFHKLSTTMNPSDFYAMLEDTFGKPAASGLMTLFTTGAEHMGDFKKSMDGVNDAQSIMDARMNTLRGSLEKFSATWLGLKKVLGDSVSGYIKPVVDLATNLVNILQNAPKPVLQAVAALTALAGVLAWIGGSMILISALTGGKGLGFLIGQSFRLALPALAPFALGLLAIGGAALLIKDNFGGVRDFLGGVTDKIDEFKERFHEGMVYGTAKKIIKGHARQDATEVEQLYTGTYMTVANALAAIRDMGGPDLLGMWKAIYPHVKEVADGVGIIGRTYERLSNVIKKKGLAEGLRQLFTGDIGKDLLKGIGDILSEGPRLLGTFLRNFDTGSKRINGILKNFGSAFLMLGTVIEAVLDGEWGKAWSAFERLVVRTVKGGLGVGSVLIDIAGWLFQSGKDLYDELKIWIMGKITGSGDTRGTHRPRGAQAQDVPSLGTVTVGIAGWAFTEGTRLIDSFTTWIGEKLNELFPDGGTTPEHVTGRALPVDNARIITIDGIQFEMTPGVITWKSTVQWALIASRLLGVADEKLTEALGMDRSDAEVSRSYKSGEKAGEKLVDNVIKGVNAGIDFAFEQAKKDKSGGNGDAGPSKERMSRLWDTIHTIFTWEPIDTSGQHSVFDQAFAWGQGIANKVHNRVIDGLNSTIYGGAGNRVNQPGDGPMGEIIPNSLTENWWQRFADNLGLGERGPLGDLIAKAADAIGLSWADLQGVLDEIWGYFSDPPEISEVDWGSIFGPVGDGLVSAWNSMVNTIRDTINIPDWLVKYATGDYIGAIKSLFGSKKEAETNSYIGNAPPMHPFPNNSLLPKPSAAPTPGTNPPATPPPVTVPTPEIQPTGTPAAFLNLSTSAQTGVDAAGKILSTFAKSVPMTMDGFRSNMERVANEAMSRFQTAIGIGFGGASRIASFGAQLVAIAAKPRDLYNDGFNVGYLLGQGMAAGMIATLGLIASARAEMEFTAGGGHAKSDPFSGGSSTASVPAKQATVVNQTNHIQMNVSEVEELVTAANFVTNLDRNRQITLGRA